MQGRRWWLVAPWGLRSNSLTTKFNSNWLPTFQLTELLLGSFEINLICTDWIFNFGIFYAIPNWFSNIFLKLICLDLSSNLINSTLPNFPLMSGASLNLSFNQFHVSNPLSLSSATELEGKPPKKKRMSMWLRVSTGIYLF